MNELIQIIIQNTASGKIDRKIAAEMLIKLVQTRENKVYKDIAIIGMSAKLAKTNSVNEFWDAIKNGVACIRDFPEGRRKDSDILFQNINFRKRKTEYEKGGYLEEIDKFDYDYFKLSPKEASLMDPNQRLFLEAAYEAVEDAGYGGDLLKGSKTGVYVGTGNWPVYAQFISQVEPESVSLAIPGNVTSIVASRISYLLDFKGPSMILDTACSSSLVAVHLACRAIKNGECEQAIAGGVKINLGHMDDMGKIGIESSDSKTKAFDDNADGTVWGEGVAAILLKPLDKALRDKDTIYAIIKGSAVNQDGTSVGITAPNSAAQEDVIVSAWKEAGIDPSTISYIEAHGTGTKLGDPVEVESIQKAFRRYTDRVQFCAIGSVKTNIGHLDSVAGIAGLIKAVLALKHGQIPASINFSIPNRRIKFEDSPVYVNTSLRDWDTGNTPRRCGVSAFGLSGTNCHVMLEEAPGIPAVNDNGKKKGALHILTLSARNEEALGRLLRRYAEFFKNGMGQSLEDICYTANTGRGHYSCRLALVVKDGADLTEKIEMLGLSDFKDGGLPGIFYGRHKVAAHNRIIREDEISEDRVKEISSRAKTVLAEFVSDPEGSQDALYELCKLYVEGGEIDWRDLYGTGERRRVNLPVYPLERTRCWVEIPEGIGFKGLPDFDEAASPAKKPGEAGLVREITLKGKNGGPCSGLEYKIGMIWAEILGYREFDIYEGFYELGGDSITAMKVISKIAEEFPVDISFREFVDKSNIAELAAFIGEKMDKGGDNGHKAGYPLIEPDFENRNKPFPLTGVQMAYLIGRDQQFEMGGVSTHVYTEVKTKLEIGRLNQSLRKVIERHEMLRAIILTDGTQQILEKVPDYDIETKDIRHLSEGEQNAEILKNRERMSHHVFQTDRWPLFEFVAFRVSDTDSYILVGFDMLIADGFSIQIVLRELMDFYHDPYLKLPDIGLSFRDYMLAYKAFEGTGRYAASKKYWLDKVADFPAAPALPLKTNPADVSGPRFSRCSSVLEKNSWDELKRRAMKNNISPSALLCTAYAQVLAYWSNQPGLAINLTVFNRYPFHRDIEKLVGDFTSIMVLGLNLQSGSSFWENAKHVQGTLLEALEHRHYDGVEFIREITKYNGLGTQPVMPIVFTSMLFDENNSPEGMELGEIVMSTSQTPQVYLDYQATENRGCLCINWDYVEQIFEPDIINSMFEHYTGILKGLLEGNEEYKPVLSARDKILLKEFNKTEEDIVPGTLHGLFTGQVKRVPDKNAVIFDAESITYRELHERSNRIARYLREQETGANDMIGIVARRSINTIINVMGILKAGAAYVPIDPAYPEERRSYIIENSGCKLVIGPDLYAEENISQYPADDLDNVNSIEDIAYVIYTSGSTGRPKGVVISHGAASNTIIDINRKFGVDEKDRILAVSSMCFDLSVYDIFGALSTGASLVLIADQRDVPDLTRVLLEQKVTVWNSVPAIMGMVVDNLGSGCPGSDLRLVLLSGDWIPLKLPGKIKSKFEKADVISLGGATEASIWSIYHPIEKVEEGWKSIPYGRPLANQRFFVLNYNSQICPVGVQGELYIGGAGLAQRYMNDEGKTNNAFADHPWLGRLYRTGDYGVLHKEGYIEFLGRKDQQVKIKGYRIELGDIESSLLKYPSVKNAVVADIVDRSGKKCLCAYLVMENELSVPEIRSFLSKELSDYMIPSYFIGMEKIPLTPNGKIDRKSLPCPDENIDAGVEYLAPESDMEKELVDIWQKVLGIEGIGTKDNFFTIGGDSILLMKVFSEIDRLYPSKVRVIDLFAYTTVSTLAEFIKKGQGKPCGNLNLAQLPFPSGYFTDGSAGRGHSDFKFKIEGAVFQRIKDIAQKENVTPSDVLLLVYTFLLAEVTNQERIEIQTMLDRRDEVLALDMDLSDIEDFAVFFRRMSEKRLAREANAYTIGDVGAARVNKGENAIIPLYYNKALLAQKSGINNIYDIILGVDEGNDGVSILCEYNPLRLKEEKVEEFVNKYFLLIRSMINHMA